MRDFGFLCSEVWKGHSVTRAFFNKRLKKETLRGKVIDVGGGKNADYLDFMPKADGTSFETFDVKVGMQVDFEKDRLPVHDEAYDTVLFLNVMEHIFNHQHIANEVCRITKSDGQLIGLVPFLMWYHPDHSDFFRYTHEALHKIFEKAGASHIEVESVARGPFTAACQMILLSIPKIVRVPVFAFFYGLDGIFLWLRPTHSERYALGYFFKIGSNAQ